MFGFENPFSNKKPAPAEQEAHEGPQLESTDDATLELLEERMKEIAATIPETADFSEEDIKRVTFYAALQAEREGDPYTAEKVAALDESAARSALMMRAEAKPGDMEGISTMSDGKVMTDRELEQQRQQNL